MFGRTAVAVRGGPASGSIRTSNGPSVTEHATRTEPMITALHGGISTSQLGERLFERYHAIAAGCAGTGASS